MDGILANIIICVALTILLAAAAITCWSICHSLRVNKKTAIENGIHTRAISLGTIVLLIAIGAPSLLIGNVVDMCVITILVLIVIAAALVIYGKCKTLKRKCYYEEKSIV